MPPKELTIMKTIIKIIGYVSLVALVAPSLMFLAGNMELDMVKWIMTIATIVWFLAAFGNEYLEHKTG